MRRAYATFLRGMQGKTLILKAVLIISVMGVLAYLCLSPMDSTDEKISIVAGCKVMSIVGRDQTYDYYVIKCLPKVGRKLKID